MNEIRKSLQRLEKMAPLAEDTLREYRDLARAARETVPDLRKTNTEVQELARSARQALPDLRRTGEDLAAASRMWTRVGERADLFLQTNQDKLVKAVENLNEALVRVLNVLGEDNQKNLAAILQNTRTASDRLNDISRNIDEFLKDARKTMTRLTQSFEKVDALLADTQRLIADTQKVIKPFGDRGERIAAGVEEIVANGQRISGPLAERMDPMLRNLDSTLIDLRRLVGPFADRSERLARDLEQVLDRVNHTLGDVNALMRVLDQADGTLRRFLTDPSLYIHLDQVVCGITQLTPRIDRILKDFETFADKLARHPEAIGLGGVVRPGTGLKDPPTPPRGPGFPPP
jgi:ABC-type transporter Mla subunit MlaD